MLDNIAKNIYKSSGGSTKTSQDYKNEADLKSVALKIGSKTLLDLMSHATEH